MHTTLCELTNYFNQHSGQGNGTVHVNEGSSKSDNNVNVINAENVISIEETNAWL